VLRIVKGTKVLVDANVNDLVVVDLERSEVRKETLIEVMPSCK